eukprot:10095406-Heterocapsa_arctica.AAC.1
MSCSGTTKIATTGKMDYRHDRRPHGQMPSHPGADGPRPKNRGRGQPVLPKPGPPCLPTCDDEAMNDVATETLMAIPTH